MKEKLIFWCKRFFFQIMSHLQSGLEKMEEHLVHAEQAKSKWTAAEDVSRDNLQREIQHTKVGNQWSNNPTHWGRQPVVR